MDSKKQFPHPFSETARKFRDYRRKLPAKVSNMALLEMKHNFRIGGYRGDVGVTYWKERKNQIDKTRALLIKTGRLRRSMRAAPSYDYARVTANTPYAGAIHNGFKGTVKQNVKAHTRKRMGKYGVIKTNSQKKSTRIKFGRAQVGQIKVRGFSRSVKMNIPARPFLIVGTPFMNVMERETLRDLEKIFINAK